MRYAFFLSIFLLQVLPPRGVYPEAEGRRAQGQDINILLRLIRKVFRWAPVRSSMKYGTADIIR